jgi:protein-disulfide isomerase
MSRQARTTAREIRTAKLAAERRKRKVSRLVATGGGVVIVGLLVAIVVSLVNAARQDPVAAPESVVKPATATAQGAIMLGNATAPVTVELYLDYMCPFCGRFEQANGAELDRLVADGTLNLKLYPLAFLDKFSAGTRYSTRAANAVATVADRAPDRVVAFNNALFARQPAEGGPGLTDDEIATVAAGAGVAPEVVRLFTDRIFEPWVASATSTVFGTGISGTPTVKINGKVFTGDLYTVGPLTQAVAAARGQ